MAVGEKTVRNGVPAALSPKFELTMVEAYMLAERVSEALDILKFLESRVKTSGEKAEFVLDQIKSLNQSKTKNGRKKAEKLVRAYAGGARARDIICDVLANVGNAELTKNELLCYAAACVTHEDYGNKV